MTLDSGDYATLVQFLETSCGIEMEPGKDYLFESRLQPLVQALGLKSISELVSLVRRGPDKNLCRQIVESMTTHESLFFRDGTPFETLANVIVPRLMSSAKNKNIRIWSSACSTGQEPYSIAMTLLRIPEFNADWTYTIVATDISSLALKKAQDGIFSDFEIHRGCSQSNVDMFFTKVDAGWKIKESVQKNIHFSVANLLDPYIVQETFDVIFCRNVLIYFKLLTKSKVLQSLSHKLDESGYLILGGTESIYGVSEAFEHVAGDPLGVYRKKELAGKLSVAG